MLHFSSHKDTTYFGSQVKKAKNYFHMVCEDLVLRKNYEPYGVMMFISSKARLTKVLA